MQHMNIDNKLDQLKQIKQVDAPPFLFTRIRQQIHNLTEVEAPVTWKWAFALTSVLILVLNISILIKSAGNEEANVSLNKTANIENVISSMNLSTTNDLYHE